MQNRPRFARCSSAAVIAASLFATQWAIAQDGFRPRPYDGIQAGLDAYRLGEERRRSDVQEQLNLNEDLRAYSGLPSLSGETMLYRDPLRPAFEPWPYLPGHPWVYRYSTPWRQPAGRWEGQTGPNRWESHPIYDPPITPYRASPPVDSPYLDGTPYGTPRQFVYEWGNHTAAGRPDTAIDAIRTSPEVLDFVELGIVDEFDYPRRKTSELPPPPPRPATKSRSGPREF